MVRCMEIPPCCWQQELQVLIANNVNEEDERGLWPAPPLRQKRTVRELFL